MAHIVFRQSWFVGSNCVEPWVLENKLSLPIQPHDGLRIRKGKFFTVIKNLIWDDDMRSFLVDYGFIMRMDESSWGKHLAEYKEAGWEVVSSPKPASPKDATITATE